MKKFAQALAVAAALSSGCGQAPISKIKKGPNSVEITCGADNQCQDPNFIRRGCGEAAIKICCENAKPGSYCGDENSPVEQCLNDVQKNGSAKVQCDSGKVVSVKVN
jgi:hypothetical protein